VDVESESTPLVEVKLQAHGGALWGVEGSRERAEYEVVLRDGKRLVVPHSQHKCFLQERSCKLQYKLVKLSSLRGAAAWRGKKR
jgi:hypothetical protein